MVVFPHRPRVLRSRGKIGQASRYVSTEGPDRFTLLFASAETICMKKEARALHAKAVDSLVLGVDHFNRCWDRGRTEAVLIFLDRAFELLMKAIIVERGGSIRDKRDRALTIGFDHCLRKCVSDEQVKCLDDQDAMSLQNLNSLRDAAQHYIVEPSEGQLYVYAQAAITVFARLTKEVLSLPLHDEIPDRVCLVSARPPTDFGALLDLEFADIATMVSPGSRKRLDAKARIRTLSVLESSIAGEKAQPTDRELDKVVGRIAGGEGWRSIFPGVATLRIDPQGDGPELTLRITNNKGEAVRLVAEGTLGAAVVAVKKVNELDHYSLGFKGLNEKMTKRFTDLNRTSVLNLIASTNLKKDVNCYKEIAIGGITHKRYSRIALDRLIKAYLAKNSG